MSERTVNSKADTRVRIRGSVSSAFLQTVHSWTTINSSILHIGNETRKLVKATRRLRMKKIQIRAERSFRIDWFRFTWNHELNEVANNWPSILGKIRVCNEREANRNYASARSIIWPMDRYFPNRNLQFQLIDVHRVTDRNWMHEKHILNSFTELWE